MVLEEPLDFTPAFTTSTLQFKSEPVNVIVTSLLAVLILANLGSAVSKLVYFTGENRFNYHSWLRAFIFANSDDPIRILSWLFRKYAYRDSRRTQVRTRLRPGRLVVPLLARFVVLMSSIASIAITLPAEKELDGCKRGDYRLRWDPTQAVSAGEEVSVCSDIPLESDLGTVRASSSYCECSTYSGISELNPGLALVWTARNIDRGEMGIYVSYQNETYGRTMYAEWKESKARGVTYRSDVVDLDLDTGMRIAIGAIISYYPNCIEADRATIFENGWEFLRMTLTDCYMDAGIIDPILASHVRYALAWEKVNYPVRRIKFDKPNDVVEFTFYCPLKVVVTRPIANIVPLAITLVLWCLVNILVSRAVFRHGNVLDSAFHIIQELLGHDSQANPLEENTAEDEIMHLDLYKWKCKSGGDAAGHVGFLCRAGDEPVTEFDSHTIVSGCTQARSELKEAKLLCEQLQFQSNSPVAFSPSAPNLNDFENVGVTAVPVPPGTGHGGTPGLSGIPGAPPATPGLSDLPTASSAVLASTQITHMPFNPTASSYPYEGNMAHNSFGVAGGPLGSAPSPFDPRLQGFVYPEGQRPHDNAPLTNEMPTPNGNFSTSAPGTQGDHEGRSPQ